MNYIENEENNAIVNTEPHDSEVAPSLVAEGGKQYGEELSANPKGFGYTKQFFVSELPLTGIPDALYLIKVGMKNGLGIYDGYEWNVSYHRFEKVFNKAIPQFKGKDGERATPVQEIVAPKEAFEKIYKGKVAFDDDVYYKGQLLGTSEKGGEGIKIFDIGTNLTLSQLYANYPQPFFARLSSGTTGGSVYVINVTKYNSFPTASYTAELESLTNAVRYHYPQGADIALTNILGPKTYRADYLVAGVDELASNTYTIGVDFDESGVDDDVDLPSIGDSPASIFTQLHDQNVAILKIADGDTDVELKLFKVLVTTFTIVFAGVAEVNNVNYLYEVKYTNDNSSISGVAYRKTIYTAENGVGIVKYDDSAITLGQVASDLNEINTKGYHVFFDVASLQLPLYLITIYIDTVANKVRISDLVSGKKYVGVYDSEKTLYSCLQDAQDDIATLTVDCLAPIGDSTVLTGITVRVKDAQGNVIANGVYNGTPLRLPFPLFQTYDVEILTNSLTIGGITYFNPTAQTARSGTLTADTTVSFRYGSTESITNLGDIKAFINLSGITLEAKRQALVRSETNSFSVDVVIKNPETNAEYTMPCYVMAVDTFTKLVDGVEQSFTGALIQFGYQLPSDMPFDQREQLECSSGETFASDMYYFSATISGVGDKEFTQLVAGTDYQVGDDIDTYESTNNVYVFKNAINDKNIVRYGSNIYHYSNIDKWLNALGDNWFSPSYVGDILATQYEGKKGFLSWLDSTTRNLIEDNVAYEIYERSGYETANNKIYRKVVLLSGTQVAGNVNANEGTVLDYWKYLNGGVISNDANANRTTSKITSTSSKSTFWLRSPGRGYSYNAWFVSNGGNVYTSGTACYAFGVLASFTV